MINGVDKDCRLQSGTLVVYYDLSILRGLSLLSRSILRARSILRGFLSV